MQYAEPKNTHAIAFGASRHGTLLDIVLAPSTGSVFQVRDFDKIATAIAVVEASLLATIIVAAQLDVEVLGNH